MPLNQPPAVLFLGSTYAGHGTRFSNLKSNTASDKRIIAEYRSVTGWQPDGAFERLGIIPRPIAGRLRALREAAPFASIPRPDVIWLSATEVVAPYLWSQAGTLRRPVVVDLDATSTQLDSMAPWYFGRPPKGRLRRKASLLNESVVRRFASAFTPWSQWAASGLRSEGVPAERIHVIPPGVDLCAWRPAPRRVVGPDSGPLRLLFVGSDFERKGGDMLLDVLRGPLGTQLELDVVTRDNVVTQRNVRVHRAEPNTDALKTLYARADLFVMPTRAECFGIAAVEAMACGLPVIIGDVGGTRDIVDCGVSGWVIEPTTTALHRVLSTAIRDSNRLRSMGSAARRVAEQRFDGTRNDRLVVDLLCQVAQDRREAGRSGEAR